MRSGGVGISAYKNLAFTGAPGSQSSLAILDITDPAAPVYVGRTPSDPDEGYGFEEHRALRIGLRDVLVLYLASPYDAGKHAALKLFDIGNPANPTLIGAFDAIRGGYHFEIARQGPRTLALLSALQAEARSSNYGERPGFGDLFIVDITNPTCPMMVGEWGVIDEPLLGMDAFLGGPRGSRSIDFNEGVWASPNGRTAYLAYGDLGVIVLDISDPAYPRFLGRVPYDADEQGDAFEVRTVKDGSVLLRSSLTRSPFRTVISSTAFDGDRAGGEDLGTPPIHSLSGHQLTGQVVPVGVGCPDTSYLANPAGAIALVQDGGTCSRAHKAALAQTSGAIGVVFYDPNYQGGYNDWHGYGGTGDRYVDPATGEETLIGIPVVAVGWNTGSCLGQVRDGEGNLVATGCRATTDATFTATSIFAGYGRVDVFDIRNLAAPVKLGSFGGPHAMDLDYALAHRQQYGQAQRDASANHLETSGNTVYVSTWADGVRVFDLSQPSAPREIASWRQEGGSPGDYPLCAWDILLHRDLVLLNGVRHGLYILENARQ